MAFKDLREGIAELFAEAGNEEPRLAEGEAYTLAAVRARRAAKQSRYRSKARFASKLQRRRVYVLPLPQEVIEASRKQRPPYALRVGCVFCQQEFTTRERLNTHTAHHHPLEHSERCRAAHRTAASK